ncbi:MAG: hypothetical protein EOS20_09195 [Mesorhizobium sp.]|uniref:hypothetical protein n=1 Tax=Mesorhizobium sp. TaxID=1871066 RepID=UPI000FE5975B|nr:hypothetical protein [Mesorhizobium sp.]RWQ38436.1 MAG: hypothetical protein EOS20_09195 [Mesorhizobium sp.]
MAIESLYWKEELARIIKTIRPVTKPKRWSERAVCTAERDVMIGFFIVRRMIELHKVSSRVANLQLDLYSAPVTKNVTKINRFSVDKNYDWKAEKSERKPVLYVCNQFIHAYVSFVERGPDRNWSNVLIVSDYDRNNVIWRVPCVTIINLFDQTSNDWPSSGRFVFDAKQNDYKVTTD